MAAGGRREAVGPGGGWERTRFEVAGVAIELAQDLKGSNSLRPLDDDRPGAADGGDADLPPPILTPEDLSRVGLVTWQAGFLLGDLLLRRPPFAAWHGVHALDLGCGTGLVGILLALAGAHVTLTDQPHILPLAEANLQANLTPGLHTARAVGYVWGRGDAAAALLPPAPAPAERGAGEQAAAAAADAAETDATAAGALEGSPAAATATATGAGDDGGRSHAAGLPPAPAFDVITAADVVYEPERYAELAAVLRQLAAPHTLVYLAFKRRGLQEDSFLGRLEAAGFALHEVPPSLFAPEYRDEGAPGGSRYRVVRACRIE